MEIYAGLFIFGLILGGIIAWLIASSRAKGIEAVNNELRQVLQQREGEMADLRREIETEKSERARLEESERYLKGEVERLGEIEQRLGETFKALSFEALSRNTDEFMKKAQDLISMAEEKLRAQTIEGKRELEGKKELIDQSIRAIDKTLSEIKGKVEDVGKGSVEISTLVRKHEEVTRRLKDTTEHLREALASSRKRGEWGERMAEDIMRLVGMVEGINYIKQKALEVSQGRPDYTFFLPNNLKINMDVKFPLDNYQRYLDAESEHEKRRYRDELLKNARAMIKQITTRDYINPADNTVDYVILFIPNEQVYSFINEADPAIMDEALRQKVILCSPFTLYAVLAVIRQAVENFNLERTASEILRLLADFSKQWNNYKERFRVMGERLDAARREYEALITTRTNMLEKPLRKIEDLRKQKELTFDNDM
jgi:DNA recombination protein RmuC